MIRAMVRRTLLLVSLFALALSSAAAGRQRAVRPGTGYPQCSMITGTGGVTFTHDQGRTFAPIAAPAAPITYTYGLTAMVDEPDTLMAWHGDDLLLSTDAGCSWRVAATVPGADFPPKLEAARGGRVYAWSENRLFLVRWDARGAQVLKCPAEFVGFTADATNGKRLRAGAVDGSLWESTDAGDSWTRLGSLGVSPLVYRFAFDPYDLDHILAGTMAQGAYVSRDGGRNWTKATGIAAGDANVFQVLFSPADPNRTWAMGIDDQESQNGHPSHGRHIYLSDDGGASYRRVIDENPAVKLVNGPTMAAHPTNRELLYFVFGTHFQGYGTDLFRYDAGNGNLTVTHSKHDDVNALVFSRRHPHLLYLGLETITPDDSTE
jgi:photosystem II stability/assembly factor-like uncharacterized protein